MLSYAHLLYGATMTAIAEVAVLLAVPRWRRPGLVAVSGVVGFLAPFGWQLVLKITHANEFYTDLPLAAFPVSWQDTGSGVITFGLRALVLSYGPLRRAPARSAADLALATGVVALLVDVYLY